uniref:Uncharacterized protein n=1 Tax=Meloidogyne hapla TaxID=6305 RepID=A0A1I8BGC3_MELHA
MYGKELIKLSTISPFKNKNLKSKELVVALFKHNKHKQSVSSEENESDESENKEKEEEEEESLEKTNLSGEDNVDEDHEADIQENEKIDGNNALNKTITKRLLK